MKDYYLRTMTVPIPLDGRPVVIRQGKTVEYQLERTYESEDKSTRVKRRVIGKVDPVNPGRMLFLTFRSLRIQGLRRPGPGRRGLCRLRRFLFPGRPGC